MKLTIIILIFTLSVLISCKNNDKIKPNFEQEEVTVIHSEFLIDTTKFKKVKYLKIKEKKVDNTLFAYFKVGNDTLKFYYFYQNPVIYDKKVLRNDKNLNFITLVNGKLEKACLNNKDSFEASFPDYYTANFFLDDNDNILIKTKFLVGVDGATFSLCQLLTNSECIEYYDFER